jgi:ABC-type transport system involved in multi-copper enzyme maturation permease subunit
VRVVLAVLVNTFRETIRDKILYGIVFFAILMILVTLVLGQWSLHEEVRVTTDLGLAGTSLFTVLLAIVLGVSLMHKEIDRKTLYPVLSKPVARWQFLLGKYLGMALTLALAMVLLGAVFLVVLLVQGGTPSRAHALALLLVYMEVLVVTAVAILFSSFSTPFVSGVLTLGTFVVGRNLDTLELFLRAREVGVVPGLFRLATVVFPNLYLFYPSGRAIEGQWMSVHGAFVDPWYVGATAGYALAYIAACIVASILVFSRRDLV